MKGHVRKKGSSWQISWDIGEDENGKRKQRWKNVRGTKKEAQEELRRQLNLVDNNIVVDDKNITLKAHLKEWLEIVETELSPTTYERYEGIVDNHLIPNLGKIKLAKLSTQHIESYYTKAQREGRADGKGGLSKQTVLHIHRLLHKALKKAVSWQRLVRNPAAEEYITIPKPDKSERLTFTTDETLELLEKAKDNMLHLPVLLAVTIGLRRGEVTGLKWSDIDLDNRKLSVRRVLVETRAKGVQTKEPKTHRSSRSITLPSVTVKALRQYKVEQMEIALQIGSKFSNDDFIFSTPLSQLRPSQLTTNYRAFISRKGFKHVTFHDLRHTHATHLLEQNIHPKVVSERLGHSNISITLDTYSHIIPNMQEEAANKVDEVFSNE